MGLLQNLILRVALAGPFLQQSLSHAHPQPDPTANELQIRDANPAPWPTPPPLRQMMKRQVGGTEVEVLIASSKTCGYLSGVPGAALTCDGQATCSIIPDASGIGVIMCCGLAECQLHIDCLDQTVAENTKSCDDVCQLDAFTKKCDSSAPFCRTIVYPGRVRDFMCFPSPGASSMASADFTYAGQTFGDGYITTTITLTDDATALSSSQPFLLPKTSTTPTTSSSSAASSATGKPKNSSGNKEKNVGAIVGGTIGGVAAIGLLGLGAWFVMLKRRENTESTYQPSMYQQPTTPMSPATTVGGYVAGQEHYGPRDNLPAQMQPQPYQYT